MAIVCGLRSWSVSPKSGYLPRGFPGMEIVVCLFAFVVLKKNRMVVVAMIIGRHVVCRKV